MHALIVVSHPEPGSLTHRVAAEIAKSIADAGAAHTFEVADLAAEGFDPRYNPADLALFRNQGSPADVLAEQTRIERADALVLVFPVYWWSFPPRSRDGSTGCSPAAGPTAKRAAAC